MNDYRLGVGFYGGFTTECDLTQKELDRLYLIIRVARKSYYKETDPVAGEMLEKLQAIISCFITDDILRVVEKEVSALPGYVDNSKK